MDPAFDDLITEIRYLRDALRLDWKASAGGALTRHEAAAFLGVSVRKLDELSKQRELPVTRVGGKVVFRADALRTYLKKHTERTREELEKIVAKS